MSVALGVAAYAGLLVLMGMSMWRDGPGIGFSAGRIRGAFSDIGMLATLVIAGPAVIWAAVVNWRRD